MKKFLLFLMVLLTLLSACGAAPPHVAEEGSCPNSVTDVASAYQLQMTTRIAGAAGITAAIEGAYYADFSTGISYFDETTGQSVPLCSRPECRHVDESCTAHVDVPLYQLFMNPEKDMLFLSYPKVEDFETYNPIYHIYTMDTNGANRREVFRLDSGEMYTTFVFNGDNLYFLTCTTDKESTQTHYNLVTVNYKTGETSIIESFERTEAHAYIKIVGAYDDFILLDMNNDRTFSMIRYSVATQESFELFQYQTSGYVDANTAAFAHNENLYIIEPNGEKTAKLTKQNMRTDETVTVAQSITCFGRHSCEWFSAIFADEFMLLKSGTPPTDGSLNAHEELYAVNLQDGSEKRIDLKDEFGSPYTLLGSMQNHYIVYTKTKEVVMELANEDGTSTPSAVMIVEYAILTKDDFLNSQNVPVVLR